MNRIRQTISVALVFAMLSLGLASAQAQTQRPYRISDRQVENALRRVEADADRFRSSFSNALDRSRWNGTNTEDQLNTYVQNFESATDALRSRFFFKIETTSTAVQPPSASRSISIGVAALSRSFSVSIT